MLDHEDADRIAVDVDALRYARVLPLDVVQHKGSGHAGTAVSLAPFMSVLFAEHLRHDPADPDWPGRDRFVLSCGHTSLSLYLQLFLHGYGLEMADLKAAGTLDSLTPGHPEFGHTPGVETTTGPLGQGIGNAVGMAMAARRVRGMLDSDAPDNTSPFDYRVYCLASDGDLQEGLSHEAAALAGHLRLGNLVLIWDDNRISIEGDTAVSTSEDVAARMAAYGWRIVDIADGESLRDVRTGLDAAGFDERGTSEEEARRMDAAGFDERGTSEEEARRVDAAGFDERGTSEEEARRLDAATAGDGRPVFVRLRTRIGHPMPRIGGTARAHAGAPGAAEVAATKRALGLDPDASFVMPEDLLAHARCASAARAARIRAEWQRRFDRWSAQHPDRVALLDRLRARRLAPGWDADLPSFAPGAALATRMASAATLAALGASVEELWGGSADLAETNGTWTGGLPSLLPPGSDSAEWPGDEYGRILHFGVREHAMGAVLNGIALNGLTRVFGATFFVFSDYLRPAVRLAALMKLPVLYIWTHDSVAVGEDGPTHQPVEHLWAYRAIPGLSVVRPADANEVVAAYRQIFAADSGPTAMVLSRQALPVLDNPEAVAVGVARGGYVLVDPDEAPRVILIATGSEVQLAVAAEAALRAQGVPARVVSMPCVEWFDRQPADYRDRVLPPQLAARVSIEAGVAQGWHRFVGLAGATVSVEGYGLSGDGAEVLRRKGINLDAVLAAVDTVLARR